ncbi:hypothetical protein BKA70DRAFT_1259674 [Coprinopsis sp. MPI-PUGE-AT-0042]|nr:hypothetical protein BKA70DRAFT_1259674 [Coprinopsis sp. MPI-PUGE-AT-0042]
MVRTMNVVPTHDTPLKRTKSTRTKRLGKTARESSSSATTHSPKAQESYASSSSVVEDSEAQGASCTSLPAWLMKTFKTLVHNHPLRLLLPQGYRNEESHRETRTDQAPLAPSADDPDNDAIFAFNPFHAPEAEPMAPEPVLPPPDTLSNAPTALPFHAPGPFSSSSVLRASRPIPIMSPAGKQNVYSAHDWQAPLDDLDLDELSYIYATPGPASSIINTEHSDPELEDSPSSASEPTHVNPASDTGYEEDSASQLDFRWEKFDRNRIVAPSVCTSSIYQLQDQSDYDAATRDLQNSFTSPRKVQALSEVGRYDETRWQPYMQLATHPSREESAAEDADEDADDDLNFYAPEGGTGLIPTLPGRSPRHGMRSASPAADAANSQTEELQTASQVAFAPAPGIFISPLRGSQPASERTRPPKTYDGGLEHGSSDDNDSIRSWSGH